MAQSRSWSSTTFERGVALAGNQCLDIKSVGGMPPDDQILAMEEELRELEAVYLVYLTMFVLLLAWGWFRGAGFMMSCAWPGARVSSQGEVYANGGCHTGFRPWQCEAGCGYSFDTADPVLRAGTSEQPGHRSFNAHT